jgi:hypothetical protein
VEDPSGVYFSHIGSSAASDSRSDSVFLKTAELGDTWWPRTAREAREQ